MICCQLKNIFNRKSIDLIRNDVKYLSSLSEKKRFYQSVTITANDDKYEINLDGRKLKTPNGQLLYTHNQWLAAIVANEWQSQQEVIRMSSMHLTQLTNTAIDNPNHKTEESIAKNILDFIDSDTLCFRVNDPKELSDLQRNQWNPWIEWFEHRFDSTIPVTQTVHLSPISETTKNSIYRHLCSHNRWSLEGLLFVTENLKSLILALALSQRRISVDQSVQLSRLEEEFQIEKWGRLELTHDLDLHAIRARVAAGLLFYFGNCEVRQLSQKGDSFAQTLRTVA